MKLSDINAKYVDMGEFDVIVVGAGHAGCEAGLACARMGMRTLMLTINIEAVAMMPCNPSIGGTGKGHLVREIDALGGEMGINIDKSFIQSRMLNTSKGPAVHSLRAQADKNRYHIEMKKTLEKEELLFLKQGEAVDLIYTDSDGSKYIQHESGKESGSHMDESMPRSRVCGIVTRTDTYYLAKAVIICTGTFLGGKIFIGEAAYSSGPANLAPSDTLAANLRLEGFPMRRFKTGTPARMLGRTIRYEEMKEQRGNEEVVPFSFMNEGKIYDNDQVSCWLSYTNEEGHRIIMDNLERSAMYSGNIVGIGPRYCPSIEDKVARFRSRSRHQLFVEPEGIDTDEMYIQGMSSSLPEDVQHDFYKTIPGLEEAEIVRPAYAIEYDCIDPLTLRPSLENKDVENLFCAGQFNGSSGYEEAGAQGLMAGINAVRKIRGEDPLVLRRDQAYIGVLIDDLVTKGTNEPYRMMTSRAEYRLLLRQDNADIRLTPIGYEIGLAGKERYDCYIKKKNRVDGEVERLAKRRLPREIEEKILSKKGGVLGDNVPTLYDLLKRPEISYDDIAEEDKEACDLSRSERYEVEAQIKYDGYIRKQYRQVAKMRRLEGKKIPEDIDYDAIRGLRIEAQQKLREIDPLTVGQAARISGVSPADINVLIVYLERRRKSDDQI